MHIFRNINKIVPKTSIVNCINFCAIPNFFSSIPLPKILSEIQKTSTLRFLLISSQKNKDAIFASYHRRKSELSLIIIKGLRLLELTGGNNDFVHRRYNSINNNDDNTSERYFEAVAIIGQLKRSGCFGAQCHSIIIMTTIVVIIIYVRHFGLCCICLHRSLQPVHAGVYVEWFAR